MNPMDPMDDFARHDPPRAAAEKETLSSFLDYHRATLLWKVAGLSDDDLRRSIVPSGVTLLGMVKHLAYVERWWFQAVFAGESVTFPWTDADPDADWRVEASETTDEIIVLYKAEVRRSREIVAGANLEAHAQAEARHGKAEESLRWIVVHMIEETARHNGHADILRELTDGKTGE